MFRNLRLYRINDNWPESEELLSQTLENAGFEACGPLTERSSGFMPISPETSATLARRVNGADLMRLRSQSRVLPHSVIKEELEVRIEEFRSRMNEDPSPREKRRLKAETRDELLPKALLKSDKIWAYVDIKEKLLGIDAAQATAAERLLRRLRAAFGELNIRPLGFKQPVNELLTQIFLGSAPKQIVVGRECRMQDAGDAASVVRWSQFDLDDPTIRNHVAGGMHLTHLAIEYDNLFSCVIDENGVISKLRFLGVDDDSPKHEEALAKLDTEFVLMSGTLRFFLADLKKLLGGFA